VVFNALMPFWVELNQLRSGKELDMFDEFTTFKKMKDYRPSSSTDQIKQQSRRTQNNDDQAHMVSILFYLN
jgi:hypothetical protein